MVNMTDLIKPDPYLPLYAYQKAEHPEHKIVLRQYRKTDVEAVDELVELSRGRTDVRTESDWTLLDKIIMFYTQRWPQEWEEFKNTLPDIRETRGEGGYSGSKEIKYLAAIPLRLERLIKACFPYNQWNKKFANKFVKRFSRGFQVGGVNN